MREIAEHANLTHQSVPNSTAEQEGLAEGRLLLHKALPHETNPFSGMQA